MINFIGNYYLSLYLLFTLSINSSHSFLKAFHKYNQISTKVNRFEMSSQQPDFKWRKVLLEINFPSSFITTIINDDYIHNFVKDVKDELYINVLGGGGDFATEGAVTSYISEVYSQIWDEMILSNNLNLSCFVVSSMLSPDLNHVYNNPTLEHIAISDKNSQTKIVNSRESAGVSDIGIHYLSNKLADSLSSPDKIDPPRLHFLDDTRLPSIPRFKKIALGGTFDRLHNGHKKLLTLATFIATEMIIIGITGDEMLKGKSNSNLIAQVHERSALVTQFMGSFIGRDPAYSIVEITDPYGPTITDESIQAILVSSETIAGALKINEIRKDKGFPALDIIISRRSNVATLSSTFLRKNN